MFLVKHNRSHLLQFFVLQEVLLQLFFHYAHSQGAPSLEDPFHPFHRYR